MATWGDIKLAALKKMDPSITNLTVQRSTKDYLNAIIPAANRGLQDLATAGRFIIKDFDIMTSDVKNLLEAGCGIYQHINDDLEFTCDSGKAYYFELSGPAAVNIFVDDSLSRTVENTAPAGFIPFKGKLVNDGNKQVKIVFSGAFPYQFRNIALYDVNFQDDSTVWDFSKRSRYRLKELVPDFFKLVSEDVVLESEDKSYTKFKDFEWEGDDTLILDATKQGAYKIHYYAYPKEITTDTPDDEELVLDPDVANLLPVFIAAELYEDDDSSQAYYFRQQYEAAKANLIPSGAKTKAEFEDVWGWN